MTDPSHTPTRRRQPSAATRWLKQARAMRILTGLQRGASLSEIAHREGLSLRRMRDVASQAIRAHERLDAAEGPRRLHLYRLNHALDLAISAIHSGRAVAIGQILPILRELDQYSEIGSAPNAEINAKTEA